MFKRGHEREERHRNITLKRDHTSHVFPVFKIQEWFVETRYQRRVVKYREEMLVNWILAEFDKCVPFCL